MQINSKWNFAPDLHTELEIRFIEDGRPVQLEK
jgi:hypothetical protein